MPRQTGKRQVNPMDRLNQISQTITDVYKDPINAIRKNGGRKNLDRFSQDQLQMTQNIGLGIKTLTDKLMLSFEEQRKLSVEQNKKLETIAKRLDTLRRHAIDEKNLLKGIANTSIKQANTLVKIETNLRDMNLKFDSIIDSNQKARTEAQTDKKSAAVAFGGTTAASGLIKPGIGSTGGGGGGGSGRGGLLDAIASVAEFSIVAKTVRALGGSIKSIFSRESTDVEPIKKPRAKRKATRSRATINNAPAEAAPDEIPTNSMGVRKTQPLNGAAPATPAETEAATAAAEKAASEAEQAAIKQVKMVRRVGSIAGKLMSALYVFEEAFNEYGAVKNRKDLTGIGKARHIAVKTATTFVGSEGGAMGGALGGAMLGGAIGSVVPVVGTVLGAGVGAVAGGIAGAWYGGKAGEVAGDYANKDIDTYLNKPSAPITKYSKDPAADKIANFISKNEGSGSKAAESGKVYDDGFGNDTIGYGHKLTSREKEKGIINVNGKDIPFSTGLTKEQVKDLFKQDLSKYVAGTISRVGNDTWSKLTDDQKAALVDYYYNTGSTPHGYKEAMDRGNVKAAAATFDSATTAIGSSDVVPGLEHRRMREIAKTLGIPESIVEGTVVPKPSTDGKDIHEKSMAAARKDKTVVIASAGDSTVINSSGGKSTGAGTVVRISGSAPVNSVDLIGAIT